MLKLDRKYIGETARGNLPLGFAAVKDTNQPAQLQRLDTLLKFWIY